MVSLNILAMLSRWLDRRIDARFQVRLDSEEAEQITWYRRNLKGKALAAFEEGERIFAVSGSMSRVPGERA